MAAHKLPRLSKSLLDAPQLITESKFREIAEVLENRDSSFINAALLDPVDDKKSNSFEAANQGFGEKIGVLEIEGPLTYKPTGWEALCGIGCNYVGLIDEMKTFASEGFKTVVMMLDTPGGQAFRAFSTAKQIRNIADENGIHLVGYVNGQSCSAGYALGSVCHELVSNPDSEVGSIGVVVSLVNSSEKDKKEGIKREYITAGKSKVPYDKEGNFKADFKEDIQTKINKTYETFVQHVATMRTLDAQVVRDTEAKVFDPEQSLELGLIDSIMEEEDFRKYISSDSAAEFVSAQQLRYQNDDDEEMSVVETQPNIENKKETPLMSDVQITPEMYAELQAQLQAQSTQLETFKAKEIEAKKATISAELDNTPFLAECKDEMMSFFLSADEANVTLMNKVIDAAKAENAKVVEEAASQIAEKEEELKEANAKAEEAQADALKVKEEFGKQDAAEGTPKEKVQDVDASSGAARTAHLAQKVKEKLANK